MNWRRWICSAWLCLASMSAHALTPMIVANADSSLLLNADGSVWGAGNIANYWPGALSPVRLLNLPNVVSIATGAVVDFAVLADGSVQVVGNSNRGFFGNGSDNYFSRVPVAIPGFGNVKSLSVGTQHVLALKKDGTVWGWGGNNVGQLGDGTTTDRNIPQQALGLSNIVAISAGGDQSLALDSNGEVWFWGPDGCGQAGDGTIPVSGDPAYLKLAPVKVPNFGQVVGIAAGLGNNVVIRSDGSLWFMGSDGTTCRSLPTKVSSIDQIVAVSSGKYHYLALRADGTVWAWGGNDFGQLGVSGISHSQTWLQVPGLSQIVEVAAGATHSLARRQDGVVLAWGSNANGELADGTLAGRTTPLPMGGPGGGGQLNLVQPAPVSVNQLPSASIGVSPFSGSAPLTVTATANNPNDPDGTIVGYRWTTSDGQSAVSATVNFTFQQTGTYDVTLFMTDNVGGIGVNRIAVTVLPAAVDASLRVDPMVALGNDFGIALSNTGRIYSFGNVSELGLLQPGAATNGPKANPVPTANGITGAISMATGAVSAYVLLNDGTVLAWGNNGWGELGAGSQTEFISGPTAVSGLPQAKAIAAGSLHALALTKQGDVLAWGDNTSGQLGVGDYNSRNAPVAVTGVGSVTVLAAAANISAILKADGTVWAWGNSACNLFGTGNPNSNVPVQVPGLAGVQKIFVGDSFIFAIGAVWAAGCIQFVSKLGGVAAGGTPATYRIASLDGFVQFAGGWQSVLALKSDGTIWTWGSRNSYSLAVPGSGDVQTPQQIPRFTDVIGISSYSSRVYAIWRRDGTAATWGIYNGMGGLGDGTFAARFAPVLMVNENTDGFLTLKPGTNFELPPSVGVPFFVAASGGISTGSASVSTKSKFNAPDVGKSGSVYVTAAVPPGSLVPVQSPMSAFGRSGVSASGANGAISSAATAANSFVLIQLTSSGWQQVVNGQLIPYASGVLGDQLSAQTILNNTDTTNLAGAQFCLGYGASAEQMIAVGTMRVIASIPDPNATGTAAPSCIVAGPPVSYGLSLPQGWSLLGNSLNQALSVASLYGDSNTVTSVWKWDTSTLGWQFYTPLMDAAALQTYATGKGYGVVTTINPGEGYWVNAKAQPTLATQSGASFVLTSVYLEKGWNLAATGNDITPSAFNTNLKASLPGTGVTTLWAWDNPSSRWYFYAPSLETQGGTALSDYTSSKGYLDFTQRSKTLGSGTGFWVNR